MQATTETAGNQFDKLMRVGQRAYENDDLKTAHRAWQYAAMVNPNDTKVWELLLQVVSNEDDKAVCLQNILAIDPDNAAARNMLDDLQPPELPANQDHLLPTITLNQPVQIEEQSRSLSDWAIILGFAVITGILIGIALYWLLFNVLQIQI